MNNKQHESRKDFLTQSRKERKEVQEHRSLLGDFTP